VTHAKPPTPRAKDKGRVGLHFLPRDASAERGDATVSCPSL